MDQSLKQLFLQTLNPHESIRNNAEVRLKSLERSAEFINYTRNALMRDPDRQVQQVSSIYLMNVMERNWKLPEMSTVVSDLQNNILRLLMIEDKYPKLAYQKILQCIFDNSDRGTLEDIFNSSASFISSSDPSENKAALVLYEEVFKSESLRFNLENILEIVFNKLGSVFTSKFTEFLSTKRYSHACIAMKIVSKAYSNYSLPEFLVSPEVFGGFVHVAMQIMSEGSEDESFLRMQRWAATFLYKFANKGLKKYFKSAELISFVRKESTLESMYSAFTKILGDYIGGKKLNEKVPSTCADFFTLLASNKHTRHLIKRNYMFLISSFILPAQRYDEEMKEKFEFNGDEYLRERYNYYCSNIRSSTSELFEEILHCDKEIEANVLGSLKTFLDARTDDNSALVRYAVIGLLANSQKSIRKVFSDDGFSSFVKNYVFSDLVSPYEFLVSQALYFLSLTESLDITDNSILDALNRIVSFTSTDHEILPVEACLALNVFFYNESLKSMFKPIIANLFEKTLMLSKKHFLESLSTLMDSIIDCYTDDISMYAPQFVESICSSFMDHIERDEEDKITSISGCLTTIEKLIVAAEDQPEIVSHIYSSASKVIFYIFKNQKVDFYQESFDLMNSFLFVLELVNESMFEIFSIALSIDKDELSLYPREVGDFIDNFLSYGRETMVMPQTLELIYNVIDLFMPLESAENDIYDEDFEAACRIIDSLMLNAGHAVHGVNQNIIPAVLHKIVNNYDFASTHESLPLFALEAIMNCFIVAPSVCLSALGLFTPKFFSEIIAHIGKFKRVYDKKLFILFVGHLFKIPSGLPIDYGSLNEAFVGMLCTLPDAIKKRNKLKEDADNDEEGESEDNDSDYTADTISEDIYFETVLDKFNAYDYARTILSEVAPKTVGENFISSMNGPQVSRVKGILEAPQAEQK